MNDEAAATGADLLDRLKPGWYRRINLEQLDVSRVDSCVVAQLYNGNYAAGRHDLERLHGDHITSWRYGFSVVGIPCEIVRHREALIEYYQRLTTSWRQQVIARLYVDNFATQVDEDDDPHLDDIER